MGSSLARQLQEQMEGFRQKFRTGLVTLVFTDLVGSTRLKRVLGDREGVALIQHHHSVVRELLRQFPEAEEAGTAGDSFFIVFARPSDAVRLALLLQARNRAFSEVSRHPVQERIGIHIGEVLIQEHEDKPRDLYGSQVDIAARVMALADGDQILLTRAAFDNARQALKGEDASELQKLCWLNHGPYLVEGLEEPLEICEVGEIGLAKLKAPEDSLKARRQLSAEAESVLGWRPAVGQTVPNTKWVLEEKLGQGGFGEVWVGRHQSLKEQRVFKFCFRADHARSLRREVTLFRLLKERGDHPNIVRLYEVFLDQPPFYVEMDYVAGKDLKSWCQRQGGIEKVPLAMRLEIVAQAAEALQAAHDSFVIHRDIKPTNILISEGPRAVAATDSAPAPEPSREAVAPQITVKLTDFGIGQVVSAQYLAGITRAGFTQTMLGSPSSSPTGTQLYMAPELLAGKPASTRSDIYSIGVVLYQLLAGDFSKPLTTDWADQISDPLLREDLKRCFAGNPQERFGGAAELARRLRTLPERRAVLERRAAEAAARERAAYRRGVVRTAALATLAIVILAASASYAFNQAKRASREAERANREANRASVESRHANAKELEAQRILYASDMNLAQAALRMNNVGRARALLDRHRPQPGEADFRGWEWRYLWRRCQSDALFQLTRHDTRVHSLSFSADGLWLAIGYGDGLVQLWDVAQRKRIANLQTNGQFAAVAFSPRGGLLAATAKAGIVKLWDPVSLTQVGELKHGAPVRSVVFSPDGNLLALMGQDGRLTIWNPLTTNQLTSIAGRVIGYFRGVAAFSADSRLLAVGDAIGGLRVLEVGSWQELHRFVAREGFTALAFSSDGEFLISGSAFSDPHVRVWSLKKGALETALPGHTAWIGGLASTPGGKTMASVSADQSVRLWDTAAWKETAVLRGHGDEIHAVAFAPDGVTLATGSRDGLVLIWDSRRPQPSAARFSFPRPMARARLLEDSRTIVTFDAAHRLSLWDAATFEEKPFCQMTNSVLGMGDDGMLFTWNNVDKLEAWDMNVRPPQMAFSLPGSQKRPRIAYSERRKLLAIGEGSGAIRLAPIKDPAKAIVLTGHRTNATTLEFADKAGRLISVDSSGLLKIWDLEQMKETGSGEVGSTSWDPSPQGNFCIGVPNRYDELELLNLTRLSEPPRKFLHNAVISDAAFSPDSSLLASVDESGILRVWEMPEAKPRLNLRAHLLGAHGVAFFPDGRRFATGSGGLEALKLWDVATGQELLTLDAEGSLFRRIQFSKDGNTILAGGTNEGLWHFWRAPSFAQIEEAERKDTKPESYTQRQK